MLRKNFSRSRLRPYPRMEQKCVYWNVYARIKDIDFANHPPDSLGALQPPCSILTPLATATKPSARACR
jgi:hypothetical protein